jgi:hypothetical protein
MGDGRGRVGDADGMEVPVWWGLGLGREPSGGASGLRPAGAGGRRDGTRARRDGVLSSAGAARGTRGATAPRQFLIDLRRASARRSGCCLRAWRSAANRASLAKGATAVGRSRA